MQSTHPSRAWRLNGAFLILLAVHFSGPARADLSITDRATLLASGVVDAEVVDRLERSERADLIVLFDLPQVLAASPPDGADRARRRLRIAGRRSAILAVLDPIDFAVGHRYRSLPAFSGSFNRRALLALASRSDVVRIGLDSPVFAQLTEAVPLVGLDALHSHSVTGEGAVVGVIDTGVLLSHTDLGDDIVREQCFCAPNCCPSGGGTKSGVGAALDGHGHGTIVTGIVTSAGTVAPVGGAPDAEIVAIKALDDYGTGVFSDILAALDWIIDEAPEIDVVNMSLGTEAPLASDCDGENTETMAAGMAVDMLTANGVLVVASAGNGASGTGMRPPACLANSLSVGAVWDSDLGSQQTLFGCTDPVTAADLVACFSNSDAGTDVFAPGAHTTSTSYGGGAVTSLGTSFSSPLVAACAAALVGVDPTLTPAELANALRSSPVRVTDATNGLDFPRLDCAHAHELLFPAPTAPGLPLWGRALLAALLAGTALSWRGVGRRPPRG